jgi:REP-associated tyrosine transposase
MGAGVFHVYTHSVWASNALFVDDLDRMTFLRELARAGAKVGWQCVGYCLMRSHYHLILVVDDNALPVGMHSLNFRYACAFNSRHGSKGHVFGARYDSRRTRDTDHLLTVYRYVMRNPVEAGLCVSPEEWTWSSYAAAIGLAKRASFVDETIMFDAVGGDTRDAAVARLRRLVEES